MGARAGPDIVLSIRWSPGPVASTTSPSNTTSWDQMFKQQTVGNMSHSGGDTGTLEGVQLLSRLPFLPPTLWILLPLRPGTPVKVTTFKADPSLPLCFSSLISRCLVSSVPTILEVLSVKPRTAPATLNSCGPVSLLLEMLNGFLPIGVASRSPDPLIATASGLLLSSPLHAGQVIL